MNRRGPLRDLPRRHPDAGSRDRKAEHLKLALRPANQLRSSGFDGYRLQHHALPEIALDDVDTRVRFLDRTLRLPLLISCMTGGTDDARRINRHLALGAEACGVALGVGSQRKALEDPSLADSFAVRGLAPSVPLLANLGAIQLNYGFGVDHCRRAVEMIEADALVLHLNPLQEAIQPEGQTDFRELLPRIGAVVRALPVPVIVKEVGCGIGAADARRLLDQGVRCIDVAGTGGTSWARIEAARADDAEIGERFAGWGIPTPEAIRDLARLPGLTVIGSGGVRHGIDVALALALGAQLAGMAYPFLVAADRSPEMVIERIRRTERELRIAMFCSAARDLPALQRCRIVRRDPG